MTVEMKIVCLANSFRPGGSCVAGIEVRIDKAGNWVFGDWVRPVSHRPTRAINKYEQTCDDNKEPSLLDVVKITCDEHLPMGHQTENWLISEGVRWKKASKMTSRELARAISSQKPPPWIRLENTSKGRNDISPEEIVKNFKSSLSLVQPSVAEVSVIRNSYNNKNEVWVEFDWNKVEQKLKLTDPLQFAHFTKKGKGPHRLDDPIMCISLTGLWKMGGRKVSSKLVAGLII